MPVAESRSPTSVRALTAGGADTDTILAAMASELLAERMAEARMGGQYRLLEATYRLLDRRILDAAVTCLDQDGARPLARWLATLRELRRAAETTRSSPVKPEAMVVLTDGDRLTSSQTSKVLVYVGGTTFRVPFRLELVVNLGQTSVVIRLGAIEEVALSSNACGFFLIRRRLAGPMERSRTVPSPAPAGPVARRPTGSTGASGAGRRWRRLETFSLFCDTRDAAIGAPNVTKISLRCDECLAASPATQTCLLTRNVGSTS